MVILQQASRLSGWEPTLQRLGMEWEAQHPWARQVQTCAEQRVRLVPFSLVRSRSHTTCMLSKATSNSVVFAPPLGRGLSVAMPVGVAGPSGWVWKHSTSPEHTSEKQIEVQAVRPRAASSDLPWELLPLCFGNIQAPALHRHQIHKFWLGHPWNLPRTPLRTRVQKTSEK